MAVFAAILCFTFKDEYAVFTGSNQWAKKNGARSAPLLITVSALWAKPLTQQRQYVLRYLVGLGHNRGASLLQDLCTSHVGHFYCVVGVLNT